MRRRLTYFLVLFTLILLWACSQAPAPISSLTHIPQPPEALLPTPTIVTGVCTTVSEIPVEECAALVELYEKTNGANWNTNFEDWQGKDIWLTSSTPCSWGGVTCQAGHVIGLSLALVGLEGELPANLGNLTRLTRLDLTDNRLTSIPPELGSLTHLTELNLAFNSLSSLPGELNQLTNLTTLYLAGNQLSSLPPIGKLTNLTVLTLSDNRLTSLPPEIGSLAQLTHLALHRNPLTSLPDELCAVFSEAVFLQELCKP